MYGTNNTSLCKKNNQTKTKKSTTPIKFCELVIKTQGLVPELHVSMIPTGKPELLH